MAGPGDRLQLGVGHGRRPGRPVGGGDQGVVGPQDHPGGGGEPVQPLRQATVGDGEQHLAGRAQPAGVLDHELGQALVAAQILAGGEELGGVGRVGQQQLGQLEGEHGEDVGDGVVVEPQPVGGHQHQAAQVVAGQAGHLGRHHGPHRMADQVGVVEAQGVGDVPAQEGEVEHVLHRAFVLQLGVARPQGGVDPEAGAQGVERLLGVGQAGHRVEPQDVADGGGRVGRLPLAHGDLDAPAGGDRGAGDRLIAHQIPSGLVATRRAWSRPSSGTTRSSSGLGHQRSSPAPSFVS